MITENANEVPKGFKSKFNSAASISKGKICARF